MENQIRILNDDIIALRKDLEVIKKIVLSERELTDWAKDELVKARKTPRSKYISIEEIEQKILKR